MPFLDTWENLIEPSRGLQRAIGRAARGASWHMSCPTVCLSKAVEIGDSSIVPFCCLILYGPSSELRLNGIPNLLPDPCTTTHPLMSEAYQSHRNAVRAMESHF